MSLLSLLLAFIAVGSVNSSQWWQTKTTTDIPKYTTQPPHHGTCDAEIIFMVDMTCNDKCRAVRNQIVSMITETWTPATSYGLVSYNCNGGNAAILLTKFNTLNDAIDEFNGFAWCDINNYCGNPQCNDGLLEVEATFSRKWDANQQVVWFTGCDCNVDVCDTAKDGFCKRGINIHVISLDTFAEGSYEYDQLYRGTCFPNLASGVDEQCAIRNDDACLHSITEKLCYNRPCNVVHTPSPTLEPTSPVPLGCDFNGFQYGHAQTHSYELSPNKMTFDDAMHYCFDNYGSYPVSIIDNNHNRHLFEKLCSVSGRDCWIGNYANDRYCDAHTGMYTDDNTFHNHNPTITYDNFGNSYPQQGNGCCTVMDYNNGFWKNEDCDARRHVICPVCDTPAPLPTPEPTLFYERGCDYYGFNNGYGRAAQYVLTPNAMTFYEAKDYCFHNYGSYPVSVIDNNHNHDLWQHVCRNQPGYNGNCWIGYFVNDKHCNDYTGHFDAKDDFRSFNGGSYNNFGQYEPEQGNGCCTVMDAHDGTWENVQCDTKVRAICPVCVTPEPTARPTVRYTPRPTPRPTIRYTPRPTPRPTVRYTPRPTPRPTIRYTPRPTVRYTPRPTSRPTPKPTPRPTIRYTPRPTQRPTQHPTARYTPRPTPRPTARPTPRPTPRPTIRYTPRPTPKPTVRYTPRPTSRPTVNYTPRPTVRYTPRPTPRPTVNYTPRPTPKPTVRYTPRPTPRPTVRYTPRPTPRPTVNYTPRPTPRPTVGYTPRPTNKPTPHYPNTVTTSTEMMTGPIVNDYELGCDYSNFNNGNIQAYGYIVSEDRLNFNEAQQYCMTNYGSNPVSIMSAENNQIILDLCNKHGGNRDCWIGLFVRERKCNMDEGHYNNHNNFKPFNKNIEYRNWALHEPTQGDGCCGGINREDGTWDNHDCRRKLRVVCPVCNNGYTTRPPKYTTEHEVTTTKTNWWWHPNNN